MCQPGRIATAKSKLTTECTETTSGVERPASNKYAFWYRAQCFAEPRQPIASTPYAMRAQCPRPLARQQADALKAHEAVAEDYAIGALLVWVGTLAIAGASALVRVFAEAWRDGSLRDAGRELRARAAPGPLGRRGGHGHERAGRRVPDVRAGTRPVRRRRGRPQGDVK